MSDSNDKPTPPETWECCGGGCSPCVWDRHYDELHSWNEKNGVKVVAAEPMVDTSDDHLFR
ncbi:MAG: hypothetical protein HRU20_27085 [Pseudomonadales bacterium]|nr:hypothetical protein [Pseudomonadales bacterium]